MMIRTIYFAHDFQESPEPRKHLLELSGYVVRLLTSHQELMAALAERPPSLVLLDTLLEGKNGFAAAEEITQRYPERTYPILLCTTIYRSRPFREEALRCGAQDYFLLPVGADELLRRVNQAIAYFVPPDPQKAVA